MTTIFDTLKIDLGLTYPSLFRKFIAMQIETGLKVVHDNLIGSYFEQVKFDFLDFTNVDVKKYKVGAELYEGNLSDPANIYFQTKRFLTEESKFIKLKTHEHLLPIAKELKGKEFNFLYLSNLREGVFLINLGWGNSSLEEIAPTLEAFLPTEGIRFKLQADSNYYLLQNWTTIFDFYKRQEHERYGEVYSTDAESFDDLNSYKRFFEELFGKLVSDKLRLEDFYTKPQSSEIAIIVNSQKFELKVNQDKDWFDEGIIEQVNIKLDSLLPTTEFILLKDSKLSNGLRIALVEKSSQN